MSLEVPTFGKNPPNNQKTSQPSNQTTKHTTKKTQSHCKTKNPEKLFANQRNYTEIVQRGHPLFLFLLPFEELLI